MCLQPSDGWVALESPDGPAQGFGVGAGCRRGFFLQVDLYPKGASLGFCMWWPSSSKREAARPLATSGERVSPRFRCMGDTWRYTGPVPGAFMF